MGEKKRLELLWLKHPNTYRLDSGQGYVGGQEFTAKKDGTFFVKKNDCIIKNPQRLKYGITGAGDRLGWTEAEITPDMIGKKIGIFTSIEDKSSTDRIGLEQIIFLLNVRLGGGIAEVYKEGVKLSLDEILSMPRRKSKKNHANKEAIIEKLAKRLRSNG